MKQLLTHWKKTFSRRKLTGQGDNSPPALQEELDQAWCELSTVGENLLINKSAASAHRTLNTDHLKLKSGGLEVILTLF